MDEANYNVAWKMLIDRYNNKRLLINKQLEILMSQLPISSNIATGLQKFPDTTHECLYVLQNLGVKAEHWDEMVSYLVIQRLDTETAILYEQSMADPREPQPLNNLLKFIEQRFLPFSGFQQKTDMPKNEKIAVMYVLWYIQRINSNPTIRVKHVMENTVLYFFLLHQEQNDR